MITPGKLPLPIDQDEEAPEESLNSDPLALVLHDLDAIPVADREAAFADIEAAAQSRDWRLLLRTIGDWAATGEVYSRGMIDEVLEAYREYQEEMGCPTGS